MYKEINITINKGDTFKIPIKFKINQIITFKVTFSCSSAPEPHSYIFQKTVTVTNNTQPTDFIEKTASITLSPSDTSNIDPGDYYYDVRIIGQEEVSTLLYGILTIKPEITK